MNPAYIQSALGTLLDHLGLLHTGITMTAEGDMTRVDIDSPDASRIIGWHGETLNSLQHVLKSMIRTQEKLDRTPLVIVDVDGYRKMQEEKVIRIAEQKADFVRRTGSRVALSPMSAYFRRIVHLHVASTPTLSDLTTESVGEGEYRQVVLRLKEEKKGTAEDRGSGELSPVIEGNDGLENLDI